LYNNFSDCQEFFELGIQQPAVYKIQNPYKLRSTKCQTAWCDFDSENGWTVIQRRVNGDVDFSRKWTGYINGFGNYSGDYWFGEENS